MLYNTAMAKNCFANYYERHRVLILSLLAFWLWLPLLFFSWFPVGNASGDRAHAKLTLELLLRAQRICESTGCSNSFIFSGASDERLFDDTEYLSAEDCVIAASLFSEPAYGSEASELLDAAELKDGADDFAAIIELYRCKIDAAKISKELRGKALDEVRKFKTDIRRYLAAESLGACEGKDKNGYYPLSEQFFRRERNRGLRDCALLALACVFVLAALLSGAFLVFKDLKGLSAWLKTGEEPPENAAKSKIPRFKYLSSFYFFIFINWLSLFLAVFFGFLLDGLHHSSIIRTAELQVLIYAVNLSLIACCLPRLTVGGTDRESGRSSVPVRSVCAAIGLDGFKKSYIFEALGGYGAAVAAAALLSKITSLILGTVPRSDNVFLDLMLNANIYEFAALFILVLIGPFYEEIFFRGLLFNGLKGIFTLPLALIAASLAFALCHGDSHGLLVLTGLGAVFGWLYQRSGSLWPPILAHLMWNGGIAVYLFVLFHL